MSNPFFSVGVPTYNNEKTIERAIRSITQQTFRDFELIVADDNSTDETPETLISLAREGISDILLLHEKHWNGGTRNVILEHMTGKYVLWLDSDDNFRDENVFQELHDLILEKNFPDMVRIPYMRNNPDGSKIDQTPRLTFEKNMSDVASNCRVACWTKCIKRDLFVPFPEDTLMEDVCQSLLQYDVLETFDCMPRACIDWNIRKDSTSNGMSKKWIESAYRFPYDLFKLDLKKPYTQRVRDFKLRESLENLLKGVIKQ